MRATEILMQEHRVIEQVLCCLEQMADRCAAGAAVGLDDAAQAVEFFRVFADGCHHGKEENLLFPLLEHKGFSRQHGPTGVMLCEHETGRRLVGNMADAIDRARAGKASLGDDFVAHARAFVGLLREHIRKEDHCLFPMADQTLLEPDQRDLLDAFDKVEQDELGTSAHEKYVDLANRLALRYDVPCVSGKGSGCGGH